MPFLFSGDPPSDGSKSGGGIGPANIAALGTGVSDIFAGIGDQYKAEGDIIEGQAYTEAAQLAEQNAQFTAMSTAIQEAQAGRELSTDYASRL